MTAPLFEPDCKPCEHCGQQFAPRKHGGGRSAFALRIAVTPFAPNTDLLRSRVVPQTPARSQCRQRAPPAKSPAAAPEAPEASDPFSWSDTGNVILRPQRATAIYWGQNGDLVIRHERDWDETDDTYIGVNRNQIDVFIDQLTDIAGIPSFGKS